MSLLVATLMLVFPCWKVTLHSFDLKQMLLASGFKGVYLQSYPFYLLLNSISDAFYSNRIEFFVLWSIFLFCHYQLPCPFKYFKVVYNVRKYSIMYVIMHDFCIFPISEALWNTSVWQLHIGLQLNDFMIGMKSMTTKVLERLLKHKQPGNFWIFPFSILKIIP